MELLQHCRDFAQQFYADLLLEAQAVLSDELFEQAGQCLANDEQQHYFEASQQLKKHSNTMRSAFKHQINDYFDAFINGHDKQSTLEEKIDSTTLSLVDREALEDELAISVIVSKSNSRNTESLWKLNRRLAVLRGGKNVSDETNPFGPARIGEALQVAVNELDLDNKARIIIYKHLGKIIVERFSDVLEALNSLLVDRGILPNLQFSIANTDATPNAEHITADSSPLQKTAETAERIAHQQELFNAIRDIQTRTGPRTQTAGGVSLQGLTTAATVGAETFSAVDYVLALTAIQQSKALLARATQNLPIEVGNVEEKLFNQLHKQADHQGKHKIAQEHANTVDLVGLIFRYMLDDPNLHDAVKSLLSHLHTPYLKLALMDETFLSNYEHSARVLLNQMAAVGSSWVKDDNDRSVLPTIKKNVNTILREFVDDSTLFDELLEQFTRFTDSLEKRAQMVEKRNTESQQGLERLELSRQQAAKEIASRLQKAQITAQVSQLLEKPWTDFLAFNLLRHGEDSLSWKSALKVVDGVIWSIKPDKTTGDKEDFHRRQQELERSVTEGLKTIGYDPQASEDLIRSLKEAHELAYVECSTAETPPEPAIAEKVEQPQDTAVQNSDKSAEQPGNKCTDQQSANNTQTKVEPDIVCPPNVRKKLAESQAVTAKSGPSTTKPQITQKESQATQKKPQPNAEQTLSVDEKNTLAKLKDIAFGTWFEFKRETTAIQLKLAWFSRITCHYMFVDQAGVKQRVETQQNLARGICQGTISIVNPNEKSFMERALEAVLDTLTLKK